MSTPANCVATWRGVGTALYACARPGGHDGDHRSEDGATWWGERHHAPNAPALASVADTKHAIGCAEDRGVSCDCGATNAMLARLDHLRAAKQAPAAAPPASPPTAEERAEWRDQAEFSVRSSTPLSSESARVLRLLDAYEDAERERDDQRAAHARTCGLLMVAEHAEPLDDATVILPTLAEFEPLLDRIATRREILACYAAALREVRRLREALVTEYKARMASADDLALAKLCVADWQAVAERARTPATTPVAWVGWKRHLVLCAYCTSGDVCDEGWRILGTHSPDEAPWLTVRTPATTAPSETDRPCLLCGKYEPCVCWRAVEPSAAQNIEVLEAEWQAAEAERQFTRRAEPSADAANEVKALVEFYVDAAVRLACLRGGRALDEQETKHARCRDQVRAAIDALAARAPTVTAALEGCSECHNRHGKPTLVCSFCARAWSPQPAAMAEPCGHLYAPEDPTDLPCVLSVGHVGDHCDQTGMKWGAEAAATAEPPAEALCEWCHLPMGPPPMGPWILGCGCPKAPPAVALGAEAAFYAGRTLEAEADAADWKRKAEDAEREVARLRGIETVMKAVNDNHRAACVSIALYEAEVAALRADREARIAERNEARIAHAAACGDLDRLRADVARWEYVRSLLFTDGEAEDGKPRWAFIAMETIALPDDAVFSTITDAIDIARAAARPPDAPEATIRPSSIPRDTRSIREIDEP